MSNIYDKSSLVLIPSGTKTGKVFSQKPVSGDGDFTFTRASAATRVNADGNIEKETQNLITYSNTFDVSWSNGGTLTSGQAGYDGSNDAWLFETTASGQYIAKGQSVSGVQTFSLYAKAGSTDGVALRIIGGTNPYFYYDLNNGIVVGGGGSASKIATDITSVGNGWYRCSLSIAETSSSVRIYCATSGGDFAAGNILIQDAQLEQGLVARDVITTTTAAVYGGITDNTPRLDYTDSSCPALLLEPQRTNIFVQSEYFTGGDWDLNAGTTLTDNYATSPEGVQNATRYLGVGSSGLGDKYTLVNGTQYTISAYVKSNTGATQNCRLIGDSSNVSSDLEVTTEWTRIQYTWTSGGLTNKTNGIFRDSSNNDIDILIFALQLEAGSYATSYIPTYGSSVSRVNESSQILNIQSVIGGLEGTIFFDIKTNKTLTSTNYKQFFYYSDSSSAQAYMYISGNNYIVGNPNLGNIVSGQTIQADTRYKIAVTYKANDFKLYINGSLSATRTSGNVIDAVDITSIGSYNGVSEFNEFKFNSYMHFQQVLSNEELAALTTI